MVLPSLRGDPLLKTVPEDCKPRLLALPIVCSSSQIPSCFQNQMRQEHVHSQGSIPPPVSLAYSPGAALLSLTLSPGPRCAQEHCSACASCSKPKPAQTTWPVMLSTMDRGCHRHRSCSAEEDVCWWVLGCTTRYMRLSWHGASNP